MDQKENLSNRPGSFYEQQLCRSSSVYLVVGLGVDEGPSLRALQGLLHVFHLDGQMSLEVPAQGHAGVFGRLPAGENLIIAQQRSLVVGVQDLQCADLEEVINV